MMSKEDKKKMRSRFRRDPDLDSLFQEGVIDMDLLEDIDSGEYKNEDISGTGWKEEISKEEY